MKKTPYGSVADAMSARDVLMRVALAVCLLFGFPMRASAQQRSSDLSEHERAQLDRGEMVVRRRTQQQDGLRLVGGATWLRIQAPPEMVFRAILDTHRYTEMLPGCADARLLEHASDLQVVQLTHQQGPLTTRYVLRADIDPDRRDVSFVLDDSRPHDIRAAWGYFVVHPYGDNESILAYGVMADVGVGVVGGLLRNEVQRWLLHVPVSVRQFVERDQAQHYAER